MAWATHYLLAEFYSQDLTASDDLRLRVVSCDLVDRSFTTHEISVCLWQIRRGMLCLPEQRPKHESND